MITQAHAGLNGNVSLDYTSHTIKQNEETQKQTAASLKQKYSLVYSNEAYFFRSREGGLGLSGFLGGELFGIEKWLPEKELQPDPLSAFNNSEKNSIGNREYKPRLIYSGSLNFISPMRALPVTLNVDTSDNSLPTLQTDKLYRTFSESIFPMDFPTSYSIPKRKRMNIFADIGIPNSPSKFQVTPTSNKAVEFYKNLNDTDRNKNYLWNKLPYLYFIYDNLQNEVSNNYWTVSEDTTTTKAGIGKDKIWLNYQKSEYQNKVFSDLTWEETTFDLGTITNNGYRTYWEFFGEGEYRFKVSPVLQYIDRSGRDGFKYYNASVHTQGKVMYPTFYGWREGEIRTFLNADMKQDKEGIQALTTSYKIPIHFNYDSDTISERVKVERESNTRTSVTGGSEEFIRNNLVWSAEINKSGKILYQPRLSIENLQVGIASDTAYGAGMTVSTTNKYSQDYMLSCGYDGYYFDTLNKYTSHKLQSYASIRLDSNLNLALSSGFGYFDYTDNIYSDSSTFITKMETTSSASLNYTPESRVTMSLDGSFTMTDVIAGGRVRNPRAADAWVKKEAVTYTLSFKPEKYTIETRNRLYFEENNPEKTSAIMSFDNRTIAKYYMNRELEIAADVEYLFSKSEWEITRLKANQRLTYKYIGVGRKEYWRINENIGYTSEENKTKNGDTVGKSKGMTAGLSLNITPTAWMSMNFRANYSNGLTGTSTTPTDTITYGAGINIGGKDKKLSGDYSEGFTTAGKKESKWTISFSKSF